MKHIPIFSLLSLILLCTNVCTFFAKAPTTRKILFTSLRDGNREVYIMNPDGSEQVNITQHPADDLQAIWSPTGEQILFASDRNGVRDLYLMDPDGSNIRRVFKKEVYKKNPTWAPDGKSFAYAHVDWGKLTSTLYIATLGEQRVTEFILHGKNPAWSPDGTEIACSVDERLTLINVRTRSQKRLLPKKALFWQHHPSWSAAGDKLAFSWNNNPIPPAAAERPIWDAWQAKQTIYIVNRDGTGLQQLVDEAGSEVWYPALSPNGEQVLYTQEINGRFQIFKLDINSGLRTQLTHVVGLSLRQANTGGNWFDPAYALSVSFQPQLLTTTWGEIKKR